MGAGPGPAEAALAAVGARSRPAPRPRLPLLPPSPAAEGRGGGAPAASAAASMSSSRAKKVKMATKSCPECDQQVRRGGAWRAAGAVLSCQPSRAWLPGPLCPQCRPAQQPYRWGSVSERGEPRAGRGCAGPQYRFGAPGPAPQGPARPAPVRGLPAEPRRSSCFLSAPLACGCLSMYVLYNMRLQR